MPERQTKNCVHVTTSDGEVFPVHRTLLRSCIALTKAVRDTQSAQPEVAVEVDVAGVEQGGGPVGEPGEFGVGRFEFADAQPAVGVGGDLVGRQLGEQAVVVDGAE